MTPLFVLRSQPGCDATVRTARDLGLDAHGYPLFAVRPLDWQAPPAASFDALLIGSANALRHGGSALAAYRGKPAYAVGESTAAAAREAGLEIAATGEGGLQAMLAKIAPEHHRLLRLAGRERVTLDVPPGLEMTEREVYANQPLPMPSGLSDRLRDGGIVLLHSAEAAVHFVAECERLGIARATLAIAALGPRIAAAAGHSWAAAESAPSPNDKALLALASRMCQNDPGQIS